MKHLLVFLSPTNTFSWIYEQCTKIQIDNSISLGYKREDIILVTNFPWEYNGVKAAVVGGEHYVAVRPRSIKTTIIPHLVDQKIIEKGKIYWNHDVDAFEVNRIDARSLGLAKFDVGLTDYGWRERWCLGSFFIKSTSRDIFEKARKLIYKDLEDETAMMQLTQKPSIAKRIKRLNITYNFGMRHIGSNWGKADKPLRVVHFQPYSKRMPTLNMFMYGDNEIREPLMDRRLRKIFKFHRIK